MQPSRGTWRSGNYSSPTGYHSATALQAPQTSTTDVPPLSWAAGGGQAAFAEYLIKQGANVRVKCMDGRTPLSYAAEMGHIAMVQLLLDYEDHSTEDRDGLVALHYAAFEGHEDIVRLLVSRVANAHYGGTDCMWKAAPSPLMEAARGGQVAIVKMFLEMDAGLNGCDGTGMRALHYAARAGYGELLKESECHSPSFIFGQQGPGWY
ncbi:uncharacterized protein N7529_000897 [Penicillium soppii]|uniref:uncharacterized protein n=1 Tax=Penicillium soppii TaxID=69789 RepID=UPI002548481C|nr:uncharacterized protein N7529_000897 [Penicillium soppii]KAJ5882225.1 hypothetical protein N7529_000897 [Penicillium soppii]